MIDEQLDANVEALLRTTLREMIPKAHAADAASAAASSSDPDIFSRRAARVVTLHTPRSSVTGSRRGVATVGAAALVAAAVVGLIVFRPETTPVPTTGEQPTASASNVEATSAPSTVMSTAADVSQLPTAYRDILALFPANDWIALSVWPLGSLSIGAYDRTGRSIGFSYLESTAGHELPPGADASTSVLQDGWILSLAADAGVITTPDGDGLQLSCQQMWMQGSPGVMGSCWEPDLQPSVLADQIARTAGALMPMFREQPNDTLAELENYWPISADMERGSRILEDALGTSTAWMSLDPGVFSELAPGEPIVVELADGSKVLSMLAPYGVLIRVHVDASVPTDTAVAGVRLLNDIVTLGGPSAMTTLAP